ncbi:MAG: DUF1232 domain-containing protein [Bacteroidaceae bacterium]|nr:DUF1232 domain-containing protein [Bacteroidaceae bacterium]MBQ5911767.1 DUF1232 domain-containing protein [Bacteroidaceae bacterium]
MTTICILILAYCILGKDIKALLEKVKDVDWHSTINMVINKVRPWALKVGRTTARPILQFYYVMADKNTSTLDRVLIYGAIAYTVWPGDLVPRTIYKLLGVLDDGAAIMFVYKRIKNKITPAINTKVENTLNEWFGIEYEVIE